MNATDLYLAKYGENVKSSAIALNSVHVRYMIQCSNISLGDCLH